MSVSNHETVFMLTRYVFTYILIYTSIYPLQIYIYNPWRTSTNLPKMVSSCHQQFKIAQPCSLDFARLFVRGPQHSASFQLCWCKGQGILLCPGLEVWICLNLFESIFLRTGRCMCLRVNSQSWIIRRTVRQCSKSKCPMHSSLNKRRGFNGDLK